MCRHHGFEAPTGLLGLEQAVGTGLAEVDTLGHRHSFDLSFFSTFWTLLLLPSKKDAMRPAQPSPLKCCGMGLRGAENPEQAHKNCPGTSGVVGPLEMAVKACQAKGRRRAQL